MTIIKRTKIGILSFVVVFFAISENAFEVDCKSHFNTEKLLRNPGNQSRSIFIKENRINTFPNDYSLIELVTRLESKSLAYSCKRKTLYWIEEKERWQILAREYFETQSISVLFEDKTPKRRRKGLGSIALDFITDKLYIGYDQYNTIEVFDLKTGYHGVIRCEKLSVIYSIAIDPNEGYLFVLGEKELVRMDLDGLNIHYILQGLPWMKYALYPRTELNVFYIALDLKEKRLYWMNDKNGTISSSTYYGVDRKIHLKLDQHDAEKYAEMPSHIAFLSGIPYWIDTNQEVIRRINLSNASDSEVITEAAARKMFFINSVNCDLTAQSQATNPCDTGNGGCQHLCILSRSSESSYRCFCNVGYELAADGKSCIPPTKFIMFTQYGYVRGINWREDMKQYIEVFDRLKPRQTFCSNFDVDTKKGVFYQPSQYVMWNKEMSGKHERFLPELRANVAAFDWVTKNLYFINQYSLFEEDTFLRVLNTKNPTCSKILGTGKWTQSGLAVHPNRGYVYYQETITNVRRVFTDGSNSTLLLEKSKRISCITIDYMEDKLYWVETGTNPEDFSFVDVIYCSNLDGMNIEKVETHFLYWPTMMRIQGDWIYIINNYKESLNRVPKKGGQLEPLITSSHTCSLQIFDPSIQTIRSNHPCSCDENPCDKFCFAVPLTERDEGLKRVCGCPYGEKLADNGRTCIDNSKEEPPIVFNASLW